MAPVQRREPLLPISESVAAAPEGGSNHTHSAPPASIDDEHHFSEEMPERFNKYYERSPSLAPSYFRRGGAGAGLGEVKNGVSGDPEYYQSLAKAAQAALIHLVMKYHQVRLGHLQTLGTWLVLCCDLTGRLRVLMHDA